MFNGLKALALACCGIAPAAEPPAKLPEASWIKRLKAAGYVVVCSYGVYHFMHAASGTRSGSYTTEHGAWFAAKLDHEQWEDRN